MKLKNLGILQIIFGIIIVLVIAFQYNFKPFDAVYIKLFQLIISLLFNPMIWIAILIIFLGYKFLKVEQDINISLKSFLGRIGLKIENRKIAILLIILGSLILIFQIYNVGLFSTFSFSRLGALFFNDMNIIFMILSLALIVLGSYILTGKKS